MNELRRGADVRLNPAQAVSNPATVGMSASQLREYLARDADNDPEHPNFGKYKWLIRDERGARFVWSAVRPETKAQVRAMGTHETVAHAVKRVGWAA